MKPTFTLLIALLLAPRTGFCGSGVTVVNHADTPLYAMALSLPAKELYSALKLPPGSPLMAAGQTVALLPGRNNDQEVVRA